MKDDVSQLLRTCSPFRSFENARDAALISLLWATGLRRSELAALRVDDVDLDSMTLVVRLSKTGKSRRVSFDAQGVPTPPALPGAKREIHPLVSTAPEALWLGRCGVLGSDGIRLVIQRRRALCGVTISTHSFRRGLAARALRSGVSQASLMNLAGWTTPSMVSRYTRSVATELAIDEYRARLG